jgi:hypothetical protein
LLFGHGLTLPFGEKPGKLPKIRAVAELQFRLPSPSRHIYNPLTIAFAFRRLGAFDRAWQRPIKVDGTFA